LRFDVVTIFPAMFAAIADYGITSRAKARDSVEMNLIDLRDFSGNSRRSVDDRPYGGGPGMVMRVAPLRAAVEAVQARRAAAGLKPSKVIYLSPAGQKLTDALVKRFYRDGGCIVVAGRYEGVDQRFIDEVVDCEVSVGDFVVSGGELPAMCLIDAVIRQAPDALGDSRSAVEESFVEGLLDHPHYTRGGAGGGALTGVDGRAEAEGGTDVETVPGLLLSGHHRRIEEWRLAQRLGKTWLRRPDLLASRWLSPAEKRLLADYRALLKGRYRI
jgi:tRNA (guanine37-N1)-methyltransferase